MTQPTLTCKTGVTFTATHKNVKTGRLYLLREDVSANPGFAFAHPFELTKDGYFKSFVQVKAANLEKL